MGHYLWIKYEKNPNGKNQTSKALNGIQLEVAHPLTLQYGAPISSMDGTICGSSGGTPYIGTQGRVTSYYMDLTMQGHLLYIL